MKRAITILAALVFTINGFAQAPEKLSYQAVIRNNSNQLVVNQKVGIKISVLKNTTPVYVETHNDTTNSNGLSSIMIGGGSVVSGVFSTINWASGTYYVKTEIDPLGGTSYAITTTNQLLSVPYSLNSKTANSLVPVTRTVGETYGGGIIFYVTPDGFHGLIAETQDQTSSSIVQSYDASLYVSDPAYHSTAGKNYTDWRIPTKPELALLYAQKTVVGGFKTASSSVYLSSSHVGTTSYQFWGLDFGSGTVVWSNSSSGYIRTVRSF